MTTFDYSRITKIADRFIAKFGQDAILRIPVQGSGDAWNPGAGSFDDHGCKLVLVDYDEREKDGSTIQVRDQKAIVSAGSLDTTPDQGHMLVVQGADFAIINVSPLAPGGPVILYEMQVRR